MLKDNMSGNFLLCFLLSTNLVSQAYNEIILLKSNVYVFKVQTLLKTHQ